MPGRWRAGVPRLSGYTRVAFPVVGGHDQRSGHGEVPVRAGTGGHRNAHRLAFGLVHGVERLQRCGLRGTGATTSCANGSTQGTSSPPPMKRTGGECVIRRELAGSPLDGPGEGAARGSCATWHGRPGMRSVA